MENESAQSNSENFDHDTDVRYLTFRIRTGPIKVLKTTCPLIYKERCTDSCFEVVNYNVHGYHFMANSHVKDHSIKIGEAGKLIY